MFNSFNNRIIPMKSVAESLNDRVFTDYYYRLMLTARSIFKWENLPNNIDEKWIERYLFSEGACVFFEDESLGFMVAGMLPDSPVNHYNEPTKITPHAINYMNAKQLDNDINCVIIRNNDEMIPTAYTIQLYAYKLANIDRTIDTNIVAQKMPLIIQCTDKQRLSLKQVIAKRNENEPVIYADKNLNTDDIKVLNTQAPVVFKDLELQKHMVWNEVMSFLGINNANLDKKERMVDDEVQANNEQIEASFNIMLKARERAAEKINNIFGTNIKVSKRILKAPELISEPFESVPNDTEGVVM